VEDPSRHIFVASTGQVATLVLSRSPLSPEDLAGLRAACDRYAYDVLLSPGAPPASEVLAGLVGTRDREALQRYASGRDPDLPPPVDDRPFFFNVLPLGRPALLLRYFGSYTGVAGGNVTATLTLATILLVSLTLVVATILLPLCSAAGHGGTRAAW